MTRNNDDFVEGITPSITDIHEAVMDGHISKDQGRALSGAYQPDKVVGTYKRKNGGTFSKKASHQYSFQVRARKKQNGPYKYKNKKEE